MVATVQIVEKNTTAGTATQKDSGTVQFRNADSASTGTADPMVIPASGTDYSYEKWLRLRTEVAPDTQISNLRFHTDGSNGFGTGVDLYARASTDYPSTAGPEHSSDISTGSGWVDAFDYTTAAPLDIDGGTTSYGSTGEVGAHVVLKMAVHSSASQGTLPAETATFLYDEI